MSHGIDFFRDEVRNGFYIPTAIKQAWASSLDVLGEIDRICKKYNIRYYADWGTFLGAVRHGGFVPWDDDLDICMRRDDYEKFRKVCNKEFPKHYTIHDYERKNDHWLFLARVVGNSTICYDEEYLKNHYNFPWLSSVDIFIKDYLYDDYEQEKARDKEVMFLITLADGIRENSFERQVIIHHLNNIRIKYHIALPALPESSDTENINKLCIALYRLAEKEMAKVRPENSHRIGQIFPWVLKGNKGEPKEYYDKIIELPFEDTIMPVPAYYHTVLSGRYGNYNEIHKVWDGHTYPFFEGQKADLEKINGAPLPGFTFNVKMLERPEVDRSNSLKVIAKECLAELQRLFKDLESNPNEILIESQQLVIELGTLIEQVKGKDKECTKVVISELEKFCEAIYQCSQNLERMDIGNDGDYSHIICANTIYDESLSKALDNACNAIEKYIIHRKEVLFLPIGYREWKGFEKVYQNYFNTRKDNIIDDVSNCNISEYDIYVVPLPLLTKDPLGQVEISEEKNCEGLQIDQYPDDIVYSDWKTYNVSQHCPDIIYIQNPYDNENTYLTVPPQYYASALRKYTDKLVFIPFKDTGEFSERDGSDLYNLIHYAASPAVIYADEVIVQSENIKEHYVNALINLVKKSLYAQEIGENEIDKKRVGYKDYYNIWLRKIMVREKMIENCEKADKKRILYCIGANELSEHGNFLVEAVTKKLKAFRENKDKIKTTITLYPSDKQQWKNVDVSLSKLLFEIIDKEIASGMFDMIKLLPKKADDIAVIYDAYYGDSSPLVPAFAMQKKPVMIANYG